MLTKLQWKVFEVHGDELEDKLNEFSEQDFEVFSVSQSELNWTIVVRKTIKDSSRGGMGFRGPGND